MTESSLPLPGQPPADVAGESLHRSGAVARMLRMPVATLRVWERRYGLTQPGLSPGGQRLYSAEDVRRLALVKQLTDLGHAIGSLAPLECRSCSASRPPMRRRCRPRNSGRNRRRSARRPPAPGAWR